MKKEDLLKELHEHQMFKDIMSNVKDDAERRLVKVHAENFLSTFFKNVLEPLQKIEENEPGALKKYLSEVESSLINSGSVGK